jgi:ankyrin repeat protein
MMAIELGHQRMARYLILNSVDCAKIRPSDQIRPITLAIFHGFGKLVELMIMSGLDINEHYPITCDTLLHRACLTQSRKMVSKLIRMGAKVDALNDAHQTPLHLALINSDSRMAQYLIRKACDVNYIDALGNRPIHLAASLNDLASVQVLLDAGVDINS